MRISQKKNCTKCRALNDDEFCTLGFDNHDRIKWGCLLRPTEPCPKPLTKKDLAFCKEEIDFHKSE